METLNIKRMNKKSIVLVGMSNVGKSYWREKFAQAGFQPFWCDDKIEARLEPLLKKFGYSGIEDVARWMGQPYESQSPQNQNLYLEEEIEVMKEAINTLRSGTKPVVVDTTGSVIYTGDEILKELRELATIVMLDAPQSLQTELYQKYLAEPKPVIWGDIFVPLPGETKEESLARSYPLLLKSRDGRYRALAHKVLDYHELRQPAFTVQNFLEKIIS